MKNTSKHETVEATGFRRQLHLGRAGEQDWEDRDLHGHGDARGSRLPVRASRGQSGTPHCQWRIRVQNPLCPWLCRRHGGADVGSFFVQKIGTDHQSFNCEHNLDFSSSHQSLKVG